MKVYVWVQQFVLVSDHTVVCVFSRVPTLAELASELTLHLGDHELVRGWSHERRVEAVTRRLLKVGIDEARVADAFARAEADGPTSVVSLVNDEIRWTLAVREA